MKSIFTYNYYVELLIDNEFLTDVIKRITYLKASNDALRSARAKQY